MDNEQLYKRNKKLSKTLAIISPIIRWGFLALAVLCFIFAVKNSIGNIAEIIDKLDNSKYTSVELNTNYNYLIEKYGEWTIGTGGNGFTITFVNLKNALFSGFMIFNSILCVVCLLISILGGKILLPKISKNITANNQDMVNQTILKNNK